MAFWAAERDGEMCPEFGLPCISHRREKMRRLCPVGQTFSSARCAAPSRGRQECLTHRGENFGVSATGVASYNGELIGPALGELASGTGEPLGRLAGDAALLQ